MNGRDFLIITLNLRLTKKILWRKQQNINVVIMNKNAFYFISEGLNYLQIIINNFLCICNLTGIPYFKHVGTWFPCITMHVIF